MRKLTGIFNKYAVKLYEIFSNWFFPPLDRIKKLRAIPHFIKNYNTYQTHNRNKHFKIKLFNIWFRTFDRYNHAAELTEHYFLQDLWAAHYIFRHKIADHVDIGSRIDGFITHVLPFCKVNYVDIRPLNLNLDNLKVIEGSITNIPFEDNSIISMSSLHVIEHIGLGRYGDKVVPDGYLKAASELSRVMALGGILLLGTPVGQERVCFDAHRIFDPQTIVQSFPNLNLIEFSLIDDRGHEVIKDARFEQARNCKYGCGLFIFEKNKI